MENMVGRSFQNVEDWLFHFENNCRKSAPGNQRQRVSSTFGDVNTVGKESFKNQFAKTVQRLKMNGFLGLLIMD